MKHNSIAVQSASLDHGLRREKIWLVVVLVSYFLVTVAYGAVNPLFEAPDEQLHYYTTQLIVDTKRLPFIPPHADYDDWISQEAAQPPLYYLVGSLLIGSVDSSNAREEIWLNKYRTVGDASAINNRNYFVHTNSEEWPWTGYSLAVHMLRLFSTILGLGVLLSIYASGRLIWPSDPYRALVATGLVAFLPQFNFLFSSVSNDTLIIFLCALALWQLIRLWQTRVTRIRLLLLGITVGLSIVSKNAGTLLLVYGIGFILILAVRGRQSMAEENSSPLDQQKDGTVSISGWLLVRDMLLFFVLPAILIGGWLWVRNYILYEDAMATNQFLRFSGGDRGYSILQVFGESGGLWLSMIAVFGWFNLRPPNWVYWFWNGVVLLAAAGVIWHKLRPVKSKEMRRDEDSIQTLSWSEKLAHVLQRKFILPLILAGWVLLVYASLLVFMMKTEAAQGRLLFPTLVPLALALAYGWTADKIFRRFSPLLLSAAFVITLYCLFFILQPTYAKPNLVKTVPVEAAAIDFEMAEGLTLAAAEVETKVARPGDLVWLTLFWRTDATPAEPTAFTLGILGRDLSEIGKLHSYHGRGLYPVNLWPTEAIVADRFAVRLKEQIDAPVLAGIWAGIEDGAAGIGVGEVKIVPTSWTESTNSTLAHIDDVIALSALELGSSQVKAGDMIELGIQWRVLGNPQRNLTTLIHVGQADQPPLAVGDRPPMNGSYPTHVWQAGEVIEDSYSLHIPIDLAAGRYPLWIGMYESETLTRLPLSVDGERSPRDVYLAGWLEIEE